MALVKAENVTGPWNGLNRLTFLRQVGLMVGLAASIAVGIGIWSWSQEPGYRVLFGGLEQGDANQVVEALQQQDIPFKLDNSTGAIMVPGNEIYNARLKLAGQGLPQGTNGGAGFEGLGEQSGFGVSQFMENARYQRALEVELARTISTIANVKNARVHLAIPKQSAFVRDREPPRASVVLNLYSGRLLDEGQVAAIAHMVSSSVPNMEVSQVTVVDQRGQLLTANDSSREIALTRTQFEYTRKLEKSFVERIEGILRPILGAESVRAQVTAEVDFTAAEQTQELFDPNSSALRSEQRIQEQSQGGATAGGIPGALSNQPPGPTQVPEVAANAQPGAAAAGTAPSNNRLRETNNYELDRTISHTRFAPGRLRRLSVAVVVDDKMNVDPAGVVTRITRSPEEINRISELVMEAVGYSVQRGDSINVVNAPFTLPEEPEPLPEASFLDNPMVATIGKQVLAAVLIGLLLFGVMRPVMKSLAKLPERPAMMPMGAGGQMQEDMLSLTGQGQGQLAAPRKNNAYQNDMDRATQIVQQDPKLAAQVVKTWVAGDEG